MSGAGTQATENAAYRLCPRTPTPVVATGATRYRGVRSIVLDELGHFEDYEHKVSAKRM